MLGEHQAELAQAVPAPSETPHQLARDILADVGQALTQSFANTSPLSPLPDLLVPRLADWCTVATCDADGGLTLITATPMDTLQAGAITLQDVRHILEKYPALQQGEPCFLPCIHDVDAVHHVADVDVPVMTDEVWHLRHAQEIQQCLFVPLMLRGTLTGLLTLGMNDPGRRFDAASLSLAREVAQRAALSLENASLYKTEKRAREQAERNARYLAQLNHLAARLTPALSRDEVVQAILDEINTGIHADAAAVNLSHEDGASWGVVQAYGYPQEVMVNLQRYTVDQQMPGSYVVRTGEPLWFQSHEDFQRHFPHLSAKRIRHNIYTSAFIPMKMDGRVIGVLTLGFFQPRPFSEEDKDLLLTFASQCAQALERARLYEAEQRSRLRAERNANYLSRLLEVTSELSRALTSQHVHATFLDAAMSAVGAVKGAVYMRTLDGAHARLAYSVGYDDEIINDYGVVPLTSGLPVDVAIMTAQPVWLDSLEAFAHHFKKWVPLMQDQYLQAFAAVPLIMNGRAIGCIGLGFRQPKTLLSEEKDLLRALASQCSLSLERAHLYELQMQARNRAERSAAYLARLQEVTSVLSLTDAMTPHEVTGAILDALMSSYGATTGAISLLTASGDALVLSCFRGYDPEVAATFERLTFDRPAASVEVARTGRPVWIESQDAYLARYPRARSEFLRLRDHACVVVPIQHSGRMLGVIALNFDMPRTFSPEDKNLFMTFSAQCGQVLERARLYQQQQDANAELEMRVAARTQQLVLTNDQLVQSREELREVHTRMLTVVEAERERIAREVHDELGQLLTVIRLQIGRAKRDLNTTQPEIKESLAEGLNLVDQSIRSVRRIATELRPVILNDLGLEAALEWQLREFAARTQIVCRFDQPAGELDLEPECATAAFRIAQEALTNVMRHAQASEVRMTLQANDRRVLLKIQDNGVGIGNRPASSGQSFGVRGMKERAMSVGGRLNVRSRGEVGTTVLLVVPHTSPTLEIFEQD